MNRVDHWRPEGDPSPSSARWVTTTLTYSLQFEFIICWLRYDGLLRRSERMGGSVDSLPPVEDVCHRGLYFSRTFVTRRFTLDSSPLACPCLGITLAGTAGNSHRGDGREGEDWKGGTAEVLCRGVHPVRFNVISRVSSLSFSFLFIRHPLCPLTLPRSAFFLVHPPPRRSSPTFRLVLQAFSTPENPRLPRKKKRVGRSRDETSVEPDRDGRRNRSEERRERMVPRVEEHPSRRRHLEGPISASTSVIPPRFPHTGCRWLAFSAVSRFSHVEAVMHTHRAWATSSLAHPRVVHHQGPFLSLTHWLVLDFFAPLPLSPAFTPTCPRLFFLFHRPPCSARVRRPSPAHGERESVLSNFLADISRYNNWAFNASLLFFPPLLGLSARLSPGEDRWIIFPRATGEGLSANGQRTRANPVRGTNGNIFHRRMRWIA